MSKYITLSQSSLNIIICNIHRIRTRVVDVNAMQVLLDVETSVRRILDMEYEATTLSCVLFDRHH